VHLGAAFPSAQLEAVTVGVVAAVGEQAVGSVSRPPDAASHCRHACTNEISCSTSFLFEPVRLQARGRPVPSTRRC
jgi:hypothetical protein